MEAGQVSDVDEVCRQRVSCEVETEQVGRTSR